MHKRALPWASLLLAVLGPGSGRAAGSDSVLSALEASTPLVDIRLRSESVDQTGLGREADALTLRSRLGLQTGQIADTSILAEAGLTWPWVDHYNSSVNGKTAYPAIPDPQYYGLNRLQLTNTSLLGISLSAVPALVLLMPLVPSYTLLLVLGVFLGVGGASFAIALPMAGSSYPPRVQGLVLGLAAAGNIGAVLDGFLFPGLAARYGWQHATLAVLPLLALSAVAILLWAEDRSAKSGSALRAFAGLGISIAGLIVLVLLVNAGVFGKGKTGQLLLPLLAALLALAVLPRRYLAVLRERDTWVMMLVYSITFGGFVGMSSYVSLLLTTQYAISKLDAGFLMALLSLTGAMVRPIGGLIADRLSGVRVLFALLIAISACNFAFAAAMPSLAGGVCLLLALYLCFGLGNGATFQLVPHRWKGKTGVMTGIIGAAGGIGGFYLPVIMSMAKAGTGSYQPGFATFGTIAALAFLILATLQRQWLAWALPGETHVGLEPTTAALTE